MSLPMVYRSTFPSIFNAGLVTLILSCASPPLAAADEVVAITTQQETFFEQRIRPLLAQRCLKCHGSKKQESDLRLDSRRAVLAGGDSGAAVVAGKPSDSLLIKAVRWEEPDLEMPAGAEKLTDAQIEALEQWVVDGAVWEAFEFTPQPRRQ